MKKQEDFEQSLIFFPNPKWKNVACQGLLRIQNIANKDDKRQDSDQRWHNFHKVFRLAYIPHDIRIFTLSSLGRYEEEKRLSAGELRLCLALLVKNMLDKHNILCEEDNGFFGTVKKLRDPGVIDFDLSEKIKNCCHDMSEIIHALNPSTLSDSDYEFIISRYVRILELCNNQRILDLDLK